jgi:hypothetical protein
MQSKTTKLSDFLNEQGLTPNGNKTVYQAFIDNFDKKYAKYFGKNAYDTGNAFSFSKTKEPKFFWQMVHYQWRQVQNPENDMLWLLEGKEEPKQKEYPNPELAQEQKQIVDNPEVNSYFNLELTIEDEKAMMIDLDEDEIQKTQIEKLTAALSKAQDEIESLKKELAEEKETNMWTETYRQRTAKDTKPQYKALSASEIIALQEENTELQKMLDITLDMLEYFRQQYKAKRWK